MRAHPVRAAALAAVTVACLASCSVAAATAGTGPSGSSSSASAAPAPLTVHVSEASGGVVPFGHRLTLTATRGSLEHVRVTSGAARVPGTLEGGDGRTWTSTGPMPPGATWAWEATSPSGRHRRGTLTATAATAHAQATANIGPGRVVGVAAPIVVNFPAPVTNRAGLQRSFTVMTRPQGSTGPWKPAEGSWAWLPVAGPGATAHFRTRVFWPAHTQVRVILPLADVNWGGGVTGEQNFDWTFTIGRSQIVKADARRHDIVIYRDGRKVATYPASFGLTSQLDRNTRSGINIVTDKYPSIDMRSRKFHYSLIEHWAVRINDDGDFIHANPATVPYQGKKNVSHGCINLSTRNAAAYYATAIYGDPVEVTGTRVHLDQTRTQLYDWALTWKQWTALSAIPATPPTR